MPKPQSHWLHFSYKDKKNVRFDNPSEPYSLRCRAEDPDPNLDQVHPDLPEAEHQRDA